MADFSALAHLRQATKSWHQTIDHHPLLSPLVRPGLDIAGYGRALAALHGPISALEQRCLAGLADLGADYGLTPRQGWLDADLMDLGLVAPVVDRECPAVSDLPGLIGLLYVLEGSRLGGEVIARQLVQSLPAGAPLRFFKRSGAEAAWANFSLFATGCPPDQINLCCDTAIAAFAFILDHLDRLR